MVRQRDLMGRRLKPETTSGPIGEVLGWDQRSALHKTYRYMEQSYKLPQTGPVEDQTS